MDDLALEHLELMKQYLARSVDSARDYRDAMDRGELRLAAGYAAFTELYIDLLEGNVEVIESVAEDPELVVRARKMLSAAKETNDEVNAHLATFKRGVA